MTVKAVLVYGPDRVGKTTGIERAVKCLNNTIKYKASRHHFGPPDPEDTTYVGHYMKFFEIYQNKLKLDVRSKVINFYYFDRGHGECSFYEQYRRNRLPTRRNLLEIEMKFAETFGPGNVRSLIINCPWITARSRHRSELIEQGVDVHSEEHINFMLIRNDEHKKYYESFMEYRTWTQFPVIDVEENLIRDKEYGLMIYNDFNPLQSAGTPELPKFS